MEKFKLRDEQIEKLKEYTFNREINIPDGDEFDPAKFKILLNGQFEKKEMNVMQCMVIVSLITINVFAFFIMLFKFFL